MAEDQSNPSVATAIIGVSANATGGGSEFKSVPLAADLVPVELAKSWFVAIEAKQMLKDYSQEAELDMNMFFLGASMFDRKEKKMIAAIGSEEMVYPGDCGLFSTILTAYNHHWTLRTSPDDWWFCVIRRVARAIEKNAKKDSVRRVFVDHEGKKEIEVKVPENTIYTVDYSWFFDEMAKGIRKNVKVPEFVDGITADFSTTTPVQKVVSQITLMRSVQEYFKYTMETMCGIPALEMLGTEDDWKKLKSKLKVLRTLLEPIENDLGLQTEWWNVVEKVFDNLMATYCENPDKKWWSHIISYKREFGSGCPEYQGWITEFLEGTNKVLKIGQLSGGLVSVPLELKNPYGLQDTAKLVAGMAGFTMHNKDTARVSVQPYQGWCLLLKEDSPFRPVSEEW